MDLFLDGKYQFWMVVLVFWMVMGTAPLPSKTNYHPKFLDGTIQKRDTLVQVIVRATKTMTNHHVLIWPVLLMVMSLIALTP